MVRLIKMFLAFLALNSAITAPASAQFFPPPPGPGPAPHPLTQIGFDPNWGPVCAGIPEPNFGPAPCNMVQRELDVRNRMGSILGQLQQIGFDPVAGPICNGPLGPGPCFQVARWIAMQQVAQQQLPPLTPIGSVPGVGPICAGPLGPGPCDAVRAYLVQASLGGAPGPLNLRQVQAVGTMGGGVGPACDGPFGQMPCSLVGQLGLDRIGSGQIPPQASFGLPAVSNAGQLAAECAKRTGLDLGAFAGCTGRQVILPERQQALLDCAVSGSTTQDFAECAARESGIRLPDNQRVLADCAMRSKGEASAFADCAGGAFADRALTEDERAVLACAASPGVTSASFVACAAPRFLPGEQRAVLDCAISSSDATSFAECAAPNAGIKMSDDQRILARCALSSNGDTESFASCAGPAFLQQNLGPEEQAVLACAANAGGESSKFAACAANKLLGSNLSREQQVALRCAAESGGDIGAFGGCAAASMFNMQLNPEQQIAVQCVVGTGGNPPAAAGCMASRLTLRELTKCLTDGVGGKGCFGDTNDLVGRDGFVRRTLDQIAGGPNSVINNPDQIWGGDNSFVRNPDQIFGGSNSFVHNPGQIFGGPNSVFNNPGQLLPQPKPFQVGSIGGKRICLPWC